MRTKGWPKRSPDEAGGGEAGGWAGSPLLGPERFELELALTVTSPWGSVLSEKWG